MASGSVLTETALRNLKPKSADYRIAEPASHGHGRLIVKVRVSGAKEFYFRYRAGGLDKTVKLGD
jgi:hypothetical protein